ncbi:DNA cytosine methyltransferase [Erysipelatoclostridium ramosum]|uniref:DNA cytosine methyltransferase n=1 Tax=Thomasclavelia ramosa TaxID=1547 RepID=UPI0018A9F612|nr:DNA cytosine methyltransferase [Thomasclavelia ramosa]MDB7094775.1 DNA cytosine methyltransferase [Thomasclavelia ramosa]
MIYNVMDLFAGAGGLSLGFKQTGQVKIVAAAENNLNARKTYKRNFKLARLYSDVRTIDYADLQENVGSVDIVIGGPPCQGFSNANRQHTTVISMNNRLVKEYVRAICQLNPKAFVMENVTMLRSRVHRFFLEEQDFDNERIMALPLSEDKIEILPECVNFDNSITFLKTARTEMELVWTENFYKIINILFRYRINPTKFDTTLEKYQKKLIVQLREILHLATENEELNVLQQNDEKMAKAILQYIGKKDNFDDTILAIRDSIMMQRAIMKIKELTDNNIHVFEYKEEKGSLIAIVKSYPVLDYIRAILENEPYNYTLSENTLNAIHYGAPQRRERFIIVGLKKEMRVEYIAPEIRFTKGNYRTVHDAIADIQDIIPAKEVTSDFIELEVHPDAIGLEKELRGRALYNHITTATRATAMARFKALKAGENFHDLNPELKTTYSNAERTQNTIYMRLKYNEPSGTVVNVRKSMWIHPELDRAISIREAARLQTFPDSFIFEGTKDSQYQQVGNAVPPYLARAIAESIISILNSATE